jgi:hypothetical protein
MILERLSSIEFDVKVEEGALKSSGVTDGKSLSLM